MATVVACPMIRSPSQWPGTARSSTSAGRSEIITMSGIRPSFSDASLGAGVGRDRCASTVPVRCAAHRGPARTTTCRSSRGDTHISGSSGNSSKTRSRSAPETTRLETVLDVRDQSRRPRQLRRLRAAPPAHQPGDPRPTPDTAPRPPFSPTSRDTVDVDRANPRAIVGERLASSQPAQRSPPAQQATTDANSDGHDETASREPG